MKKIEVRPGAIFGRLTIIEEAPRRLVAGAKRRRFVCKCSCGTVIEALLIMLRSGKVRSCGCLRGINHGKSSTRLYGIWAGMKARCYSPSEPNFKFYGERGIIMCPEWVHDFTAFELWATSSGYAPGLSIDRINPNGNYEPENCRWVERKFQNSNTRRNRLLTFNGKTMTVAQWSIRVNIKEQTIRFRLNKGWTVEEALTRPVASND